MIATPPTTELREVALAGASPDTGNRGVTALCHSVIWHMRERGARRINVFDHGRGARDVIIPFGAKSANVRQVGAVLSRRVYRPENLWTMRLLNRLGGCANPGVAAIRRSQVVLDVSAGDSFTDLYGTKRFQTIMYPKWITLESDRPLVLLPQTYGPFRSAKAREQACDVIRNSCQAWARDADSFAALKELAGDDFDPARHRQGVDLAFALPTFVPASVPNELAQWVRPSARPQEQLIGLNVSGLIFNQPQTSKDQFGLKADYGEIVHQFLNWVLTETDLRVVLVSHVIAPTGHPENDFDAARRLHESIPEKWKSRVLLAPTDWSPSELKWLISRCTWFCGTRMHSTIAALSTATPAAAVSYSLKTRGVFATCEQESQVLELRHHSTEQILGGLKTSLRHRTETRKHLEQIVADVRRQATAQLDEILAAAIPEFHWSGSDGR